MRGKGALCILGKGTGGITPAYAGKSYDRGYTDGRAEDHPRVCGEKPADYIVPSDLMGSPPRMRGKD